MIITRTPFRISFFGGGTDYPAWYKENGGVVISTTIDKYCYISCRKLPPFFEYKHRIVYSKSESVSRLDEIMHPAVREIFRFMNVDEGLEVHHDGDLPARSGLGSSSAFTVGLLHALYGLKGQMVTKEKLALESIHIEHNMIKENVGSQDQIAASFGGFNKVTFHVDNTFKVTPIIFNKARLKEFKSHLLLFFTGFSRIASDIAKVQISRIHKTKKELSAIHQMVDQSISILTGNSDLTEFGKLLHESWKLKRSLSDKVSTKNIDEIYDIACGAGALGGKILGAGGGGFMLIYARPQDHENIKNKLKNLLLVPFEFENQGSQVVIYNPNGL